MSHDSVPESATPEIRLDIARESIAPGKFEGTWSSLKQFEVPEWFRDAKFGLWAHWGPQCEPEAGDWYARRMYHEGSRHYKYHLEHYGHPTERGFKDVIRGWKVERWDPEGLVAFYRDVGARYFFAMANHHDNLDLWDSAHHSWNSVRVGPKRDLVAGWEAAARACGLRFGVSVHCSHAWSWYESAQGTDRKGPRAGVPYDAGRTIERTPEGLDPNHLYEQGHRPSEGFEEPERVIQQWNWNNGASRPDRAYCERFFKRTVDLFDRFEPDLVYFDDTALPLWPVSDAGLHLAAHFYNRNILRNGETSHGVLFGKILTEEQREALVWDIERGVPNRILPFAWQTDTCLGDWHYDRSIYREDRYKNARTVVHMLADVVSKNGNLLLSVPVRGNGSIDEKETAVLEEIGSWLRVNGESIFETRPWKVFGEGPASAGAELSAQGFNEGKGKPFTAEDIRFTAAKDAKTLYAIVLGKPEGPVSIESFGNDAELADGEIADVARLGGTESVKWRRDAGALVIDPMREPPSSAIATVFRIVMRP